MESDTEFEELDLDVEVQHPHHNIDSFHANTPAQPSNDQEDTLDNELDLEDSGSSFDGDGSDVTDEDEEDSELDEEAISMSMTMNHISDESLMELIAYNASYMEIIQKLIDKTDRAVQENTEAMEMIQEQLAEENDGEPSAAKISLVILDKPYFKDRHGMAAQSNSEAATLYKTHLLPCLLKEDYPWAEHDINKLKDAVKRNMIKQMNLQIHSRMTLLQDKLKHFTAANSDEDRVAWQEEIQTIKRKIAFNENLPHSKIFNGDYSHVDWVEIAMFDFNGEKTPMQVKMKWCNEECPEINDSPWTEKEDNILKENALQSWTNWKFITHEMGTNRSEFHAMCRAKELTLRVFKEPQMWTSEEDEKLLSIISNCRNSESIPWDKVAKLVGTRNANQCKIRFNQSLVNTAHHGKWSDAEDIFLLDAVNNYGPIDWDRIALRVPGRNSRQCRARYMNTLDVNREVDPWQAEDDELLLEAVRICGRGFWSELSSMFPGRTPLDLRSRYRSFVLNKHYNRSLKYAYICSQTAQLKERKEVTISRFQELESEEVNTELHDKTFKRFGVGGYVVKGGKFAGEDQTRERLGDIHIYMSGIYRKPQVTSDRRKARFEKFVANMDRADVVKLRDIRAEIEEKKIAKAEKEKAAEMEGPDVLDKFIKKQANEDAIRLTELMREIVTVEENDLKNISRQKLPRVRVRRKYPMRRAAPKMDPAVAAKKLEEAALIKDVRKRYDVIRELPIIPALIKVLGLQEHQAYHSDGSVRRIQDLVLMEDHDGNPYWATVRDELILNLIEELNRTLYSNSMSKYEHDWRLYSSSRCEEYFRKKLQIYFIPPVIYPDPTKYPRLENYQTLISDVMLPCRATLTGVEQYRLKGRKICNKNATRYFDKIDKNGSHIYMDNSELDTGRLDIRLSKTITNSDEYQRLRCQMFKMFFLPMVMEYGQRSAGFRGDVMEKIRLEKRRRFMEKQNEETGAYSEVVQRYQNESILLGPSTSALHRVKAEEKIRESDRRLDDSIDSVMDMISKSIASNPPTSTAPLPKPRPRNKQRAQAEADGLIEKQPPRKRRKRKNSSDDEAEILLPSSAEFRESAPEGMEVIMINPNVDTTSVGAYRPRWVTKKLKNRENNTGELTLADLLFVRGRKQKRVQSGLYDLQHTDALLDTLRPSVLAQKQQQQEQSAPTPTSTQPPTSETTLRRQTSEFDEPMVKREPSDPGSASKR